VQEGPRGAGLRYWCGISEAGFFGAAFFGAGFFDEGFFAGVLPSFVFGVGRSLVGFCATASFEAEPGALSGADFAVDGFFCAGFFCADFACVSFWGAGLFCAVAVAVAVAGFGDAGSCGVGFCGVERGVAWASFCDASSATTA